MSTETNATLLRAYRSAVEAGQDTIADMLEDVILEKMGPNSPVTREVTLAPAELSKEAMYELLYGPSNVTTRATMECTGIDHLSREVTS